MDNAASEKQVKKMASKGERLRHQEISDLKQVGDQSIHGRRLLWRILSRCGTFESAHHASGSQVYYNIGRQDLGHWLMAEILAADQELYFKMQREAKDYENV